MQLFSQPDTQVLRAYRLKQQTQQYSTTSTQQFSHWDMDLCTNYCPVQAYLHRVFEIKTNNCHILWAASAIVMVEYIAQKDQMTSISQQWSGCVPAEADGTELAYAQMAPAKWLQNMLLLATGAMTVGIELESHHFQCTGPVWRISRGLFWGLKFNLRK